MERRAQGHALNDDAGTPVLVVGVHDVERREAAGDPLDRQRHLGRHLGTLRVVVVSDGGVPLTLAHPHLVSIADVLAYPSGLSKESKTSALFGTSAYSTFGRRFNCATFLPLAASLLRHL